MKSNILSDEDYTKILQIKYKSKEIIFKSAEWKPLSDTIEGFMGDHYILKLKYILKNQELSQKFFIKTRPIKTKVQQEMAINFIAFEKEIFLYNNLLKEFKKLGYDTTFAPKSYYCKNNDTIVMEDLKLKEFKITHRNIFYDLEHCKVALKALAIYHANSMSYEEHITKKTGKTFQINEQRPDIFKEFLFGSEIGFGFEYINSGYECFLKLLHSMPESQEWKCSFEDKLKSFNVNEMFIKSLPYRKTCCHGDLWSNNMLFQYINDSPVHCCLVDFQLMRYHHPAFDVLLMLYENTTRDFRKKHLLQLLSYYYDNFEMIVKNNGFDASTMLSRKDFFESVKFMKPVALFNAAVTKQIIVLPSDLLSSAVLSGGDDLNNIIFSQKRADLILKGIEKHEYIKSIIFDDLYDLYELI